MIQKVRDLGGYVLLVMLLAASLSMTGGGSGNIYGAVINTEEAEAAGIWEAPRGEETGSQIDWSKIHAQAAVLMDGDSGRILAEKNGDKILPMASTTKILTCILVIESGRLDDIFTVSSYAASMPDVKMGARAQEQYRAEDLLYSLMLESHNDAAVILAEGMAGTTADFAELMNRKAYELGCCNSYFITPNGLDAEDDGGCHSTTAEDLARIMKYCIQNEKFLEITSCSSYTFREVNGKRTVYCQNHNAFLQMMDGAISGKTGFTGKAGYCYVGALKRDERVFIVALLACGWPGNRSYKWADTRRLLDYGLANYQYRVLSKKGEIALSRVQIPVSEGQTESAEVQCESPEIRMLVREGEKLEYRESIMSQLKAPVESGTVIGNVSYYLANELVHIEPIIVKDDVKKMDYSCFLNKVWRIFWRDMTES